MRVYNNLLQPPPYISFLGVVEDCCILSLLHRRLTVRISPQLLPPEISDIFSPPLPGSLQVWDIRQKNAIQTLNNTYQITTVAFNDTNEQLFSGGIDNEIKVWRTHTHMYMYFGTWKSFPPFLSPLPLPPSLPPFLSPLPPSSPLCPQNEDIFPIKLS